MILKGLTLRFILENIMMLIAIPPHMMLPYVPKTGLPYGLKFNSCFTALESGKDFNAL